MPDASIASPSPTDPNAPPSTVSQRRVVALLLPAAAAMTSLFQGIQQILLPAQIESIDAAAKISNLSIAATASSIAAVIGLLAGGAISDRTWGRWGRRTPSLVVAAIVSAVLALAMGASSALIPLVFFYSALWFSANYYQGALTAILPDRISVERRGVGSAVLALAIPIGVVVGVNVAAHTSRPIAYAVLAGLFLTGMAALVLFAPEPAAPPRPRAQERRKIDVIAGVLGFVASFRSRDFTLAFVSRALMFFSVFTVSGYTYYILQDHIGVEALPGQNLQQGVSTLVSIQMVLCLFSAAVGGWLADRWRRPKLFVGASAIGMAIALAVPIVSPTWPAMIVLEVFLGLFFGAYLAVDLALMSLVLPDRQSEGRDMAILAVATSAPQILAPVIAATMIGLFGYPSLFVFGAVAALLSGIVVFFIKGVR
ncbi:MFS transporter [soil metagenome]